jgi:pimeloyl-ACP methyl ester carboxylesterase
MATKNLLTTPRLEGTVTLDDGRRLGFAEFGSARGRAVFWLHGTPGARRQIPEPARIAAVEHGVRLIGVDRPGSARRARTSMTSWSTSPPIFASSPSDSASGSSA